MFDHTTTQQPSHPAGCPCTGCAAERVELEQCLSVLRDAGEIPAEIVDAD